MAAMQVRLPGTNTGTSIELIPPELELDPAESATPQGTKPDTVSNVRWLVVEVDGSAAAWQWSIPDLSKPELAEA